MRLNLSRLLRPGFVGNANPRRRPDGLCTGISNTVIVYNPNTRLDLRTIGSFSAQLCQIQIVDKTLANFAIIDPPRRLGFQSVHFRRVSEYCNHFLPVQLVSKTLVFPTIDFGQFLEKVVFYRLAADLIGTNPDDLTLLFFKKFSPLRGETKNVRFEDTL